jgi:tetratricopeptide (TPR) repeat protein
VWQTELWELAGHYALQAGDAQTALRYLEWVDQAAPRVTFATQDRLSTQGLNDLGDAYQQVGNLNAALGAWQRAISQAGLSSELLERLVQAHLALGNYSAASDELEALVSLKPDDPELHYRLGLLVAAQAPEAALQHLEKAEAGNPSLEAGIETLRRSILSARASDDPAYALVTAGRALASLEEWGLAAEAFRRATLARPSYAEAWAYLGEAQQHLSPPDVSQNPDPLKPGDGLEELQKAVKLDPNSLAANLFLALYWSRLERYDLALEAIQTARTLDPKNPDLQAEYARNLAASGDLYGAYDAYQQAIALAPLDPAYRRQLVDFSLKYSFEVEQVALPVARQLVIEDPGEPANLVLMAQVLIKQGDLANAERFLNRALQSDPNYAPAHLQLGLVYILQGKKAAALQELNLASATAPDGPVAVQARRMVETYFP